MRAFLINLSLAFGSILILSLGLEVAFRLIQIDSAPQWSDRPKFYLNPPAAQTMQAQTHTEQKPAGTYRIAVVGDSFSFAPFMQFDDAYPKRLERILALNSKHLPVEVINYSVPGYSTRHEQAEAARALKEQADLVLLQLTLNDLEIKPYRPVGIQVKKNDRGVWMPDEQSGFLLRNSKLIGFIFGRFHNWTSEKDYINYYNTLYQDKRSVKLFINSLHNIRKDCEEKKVPLVAVLFPLFGHPLDENYPFLAQHEFIRNRLVREKIPYFDLLEIYKDIPLSRLQTIPGQDYHPNEIGHRIAAETIYAWLLKSGLISGDFIVPEYTERDQILLREGLRVK